MDYKALSLRCPINHLWWPFSLSSSLPSSGIISPSSRHHLHSIHHYSTSIQLSLTQINFITVISICLSTQICSDCLYHAGISLILTLLPCSTSIEPWYESTLIPTTTNCSTWASAYTLSNKTVAMLATLILSCKYLLTHLCWTPRL